MLVHQCKERKQCKLLPVGLIVLGFVLIIIAISADWIGVGHAPGFGLVRMFLTLFGVILFVVGVILLHFSWVVF